MLLHSPETCEVVHLAEARLQSRLLTHVCCHYRDGTLHLRGHVPTFYQKQMAQEMVRRVDGVVNVVNEIEVDSYAR